MSREHFLLACQGAQLAATIDGAAGAKAGLLIVTGGTEPRCGPWNSQARLAARIAAAGYAVMRFDRRGVGDSTGRDPGFAGSAGDIAAALAEFRARAPGAARIVAFGNCDAASALMLAGGGGADALVLANPWTFDQEGQDTAMPPAALRAHYLRRLAQPRALWRLVTGRIAPLPLLASLAGAARADPGESALFRQMIGGIADFAGPVTMLIAERDRTGQAFLAQWRANDPGLRLCPGASHGFAEPQARIWLEDQLLAALAPAT